MGYFSSTSTSTTREAADVFKFCLEHGYDETAMMVAEAICDCREATRAFLKKVLPNEYGSAEIIEYLCHDDIYWNLDEEDLFYKVCSDPKVMGETYNAAVEFFARIEAEKDL